MARRRGRPVFVLISMAGLVLVGGSQAAPAVAGTPNASVSSAPATPGQQLWVRTYNGTGNDYDQARATGVSPDGSKVFVTGHSAGSASGDDYATVAYKASNGVQLWVQRYNGPGNGTDDAEAMAVSPD